MLWKIIRGDNDVGDDFDDEHNDDGNEDVDADNDDDDDGVDDVPFFSTSVERYDKLKHFIAAAD